MNTLIYIFPKINSNNCNKNQPKKPAEAGFLRDIGVESKTKATPLPSTNQPKLII